MWTHNLVEHHEKWTGVFLSFLSHWVGPVVISGVLRRVLLATILHKGMFILRAQQSLNAQMPQLHCFSPFILLCNILYQFMFCFSNSTFHFGGHICIIQRVTVLVIFFCVCANAFLCVIIVVLIWPNFQSIPTLFQLITLSFPVKFNYARSKVCVGVRTQTKFARGYRFPYNYAFSCETFMNVWNLPC